MIAALSERIKAEDKRIDAMIEEDYPAAQKLMTIPGVGPITALAFVLIIGSPDRFDRARDVGSSSDSCQAETNPEIPISRCVSPRQETECCEGY